ncbi:hypothetical protein ACSS6W_006366 [Trichoderma asperelloides]
MFLSPDRSPGSAASLPHGISVAASHQEAANALLDIDIHPNSAGLRNDWLTGMC